VIADSLVLAGKDLRLELRRREVVLGMLQMVVTTLVIAHFAVGSLGSLAGSFRHHAEVRASAGVLWIAIVFTAILGLGRAFAPEREDGALDALNLAPVDRAAIWLSKVLSQLAFLALMEAIAVPAFWLLYLGGGGVRVLPLVGAILLADVGIGVVGVLVAALAQGARAGDVLLPVLLLPVLVPLVIAAVAATLAALGEGGSVRSSLGFLALYDTLFAALAWGIYDHLVGD
jgi:heme exporter protein B